MIGQAVRSFWRRNWWAEWRLHRRGGRVRCYGPIQLTLEAGSRLVTEGQALIGVPILGHGTDRAARTIISIGPSGDLRLGDRSIVGQGARLTVGPGGRLQIGAGTYITEGSRLAATASLTVGARCAISWGVTVLDDDGHGFGPPPYTAPVVIDDDVWIACNVTILKGVTIGSGSVIGAGSVVTRPCPPGSLIAGVPAKVIRSGINWSDASREQTQGRDD